MLGKNSEENEKDSLYVLFVFPGDEGLHSISPQVVVKLVHVHGGLVRFPGIAAFAEASQANFELHCRSLVAIAVVADDRRQWRRPVGVTLWMSGSRCRGHVVDVSGDVLAADSLLYRVDGVALSIT